MSDLLRLVLLLAIAGAAVTVLGSGLAWWMDEERRLTRYVRRSLAGPVDALIIAKGRAAGAGFSLASNEAVVLWFGGAKALLYPLHAFLGAELIVDDKVVARVHRGEPRRALDSVDTGARTVSLRLIFDNPRDPDFDLDLWLPPDGLRRDAGTPAKAIQQARSWLGRVDALMRRPGPPGAQVQAPSQPQVQVANTAPPPASKLDPEPAANEPPPWEDFDEEEDEVFDEEDEPDLFSGPKSD